MNSRGQAEQIGVILMSLVVITTVVGVVTPAVLSTTGDDPFVGVDVTVTTDEVTVTNQGGDTLPTSELLAVVRYEGTTLEVPFDSVFGGTRFEHGNEAVISLSPTASYGALVWVQVIHEPTGTVFYSERRVARAENTPAATPTPIPTPTPTPTPVPVTFAYDDADKDGNYDIGEPIYTKEELYDFDDVSVDLVIPASVGELKQSSDISIKASSIESSVKVQSTSGKVEIITTGDDGPGNLASSDVQAKNEVKITSKGDLDVSGATITSTQKTVLITSTGGGSVDASGIIVTAKGNLDITSEGEIDASGATLTSTGGTVKLVSKGDIDLRSAAMDADSDAMVDLSDPSHTLFVQGVTVDDSDDTLEYSPSGITVTGTPGSGTVQPA